MSGSDRRRAHFERAVERGLSFAPAASAVGRESRCEPFEQTLFAGCQAARFGHEFVNGDRPRLAFHANPVELACFELLVHARPGVLADIVRVPYCLFTPSSREARFTQSPRIV